MLSKRHVEIRSRLGLILIFTVVPSMEATEYDFSAMGRGSFALFPCWVLARRMNIRDPI